MTCCECCRCCCLYNGGARSGKTRAHNFICNFGALRHNDVNRNKEINKACGTRSVSRNGWVGNVVVVMFIINSIRHLYVYTCASHEDLRWTL
ncbi:hypothetical protein BgiMline_011580, partial [Biomphalaria glabrata]